MQHVPQGQLLGECRHGEFFRTPITELVYHQIYETKRETQSEIFNYIEVFCYRHWLHSALNYRSPAEYEQSAKGA
jgi:putative transposase